MRTHGGCVENLVSDNAASIVGQRCRRDTRSMLSENLRSDIMTLVGTWVEIE